MKILIVEDRPECLELMSRYAKRAHFAVDTSQDGEIGFEKAKNGQYDAIVLDIMLPRKSGLEILAGLRSLQIQTPILMVSALTGIEDRVKGLDLGADDYLIKNFAPQEFIARLRSILRRRSFRSPGNNNLIRFKDLLINLSTLKVSRGGKLIHLSRKEMGILIELLRRKNTVVSREILAERLWGEKEVQVVSNTIDVHVRSLRAKIDRPFSEKIIQTIRGFGYLIED